MRSSRLSFATLAFVALCAQVGGCQSLPAEPAAAAGGLPVVNVVTGGEASQGYATGLPAVDAPGQIAVLLPLHGRLSGAGLALQRGMTAAWFAQRSEGLPVPELRFLDSSSGDFDAVYEAAVAGGAGLVVGPLEKDHLRQLQLRTSLPVATLALNRADDPDILENLFQFGLAGEDEAIQVAHRMRADGILRAAVLAPADDWGQRIATAFARALAGDGGQVTAAATYQGNGDYAEVVRGLLELPASIARHARLERALGTDLRAEPVPRADVDAIFLVANTLQGTQIGPTLRFHHAGSLPLYATSHINGQPAPGSANDLRDVRFVEIPWIARPDRPERAALRDAWRDEDERYARLHAMGIDAFMLATRLPALARGATLPGMTGQLSLDTDRQVRRTLDWMQFRSGGAVIDAPAH